MCSLKTASILIVLLLSFVRPDKVQRQYSIYGYAQGTSYTVKYFATDSVVTKKALDSLLLQIDSSMSLYKPFSQINAFNSCSKEMKIDTHFARVMQKSFEVYKATDGLFDVTVKPLVQAWGFGSERIKSLPDSARITELLKCTGMAGLKLKGDLLQKRSPCLQVDLNGIAQGYSVDVVADHLAKKGVRSYVVEIGGELRINGTKPDGTMYKIGVEGPGQGENAEPILKHTVSFNNGAITTSGNYQKYIQQGKKRISHLIDPKTGYPLDTEMISVTVYAKDAITADGYDNALMAMTVKQAIKFVDQRKGMEAYMVYRRADGSVADTLTAGFKKLIVTQ
ncbi:FAD:protein FMN transferase [Mucilaginibacter myungsuensis]|uniref:FAD:protein FMN transferase n=1 Tax=Mucilaginibacter myungsuensis TaxID=649104 RepID=A0A929KZY8_9SPHI|nr:FAD:protein FMN transferase [Mucilaginibacter myungsuensis]MBE9663722.1 FAD:protein FMN transferase [Mucilaginibacter myungsuensis]MDN3598954.1 FAD:protein FMN transferase [Mucilaginibacter myungsuensis]